MVISAFVLRARNGWAMPALLNFCFCFLFYYDTHSLTAY